MFSKAYLKELAAEVVGWFVGGVVGAVALDVANLPELADPTIWKVALVAGAVGVLKGLAARFFGDPDTTSFRRAPVE